MSEESFYIECLTKRHHQLPEDKRGTGMSEADINALVRRARAGDKAAYDDLYAAYIPYFIALARRYTQQYGLSVFTQEDLLGLSAAAYDKAVSLYDQSRSNNRFTGLVGECFRQIMNDEVITNDPSRRLPGNRLQIIRDCKKAVRRVRQKEHRDPHDADEVYAMIQQMAREAPDRASLQKITHKKVRWFLRFCANDISLADRLPATDDMRVEDTIEAESAGRIEAFLWDATSDEMMDDEQLMVWMQHAGLTDRERDVLMQFFGIRQENPETLESISGDHSLSRERVRQIRNSALEKLRDTRDEYTSR